MSWSLAGWPHWWLPIGHIYGSDSTPRVLNRPISATGGRANPQQLLLFCFESSWSAGPCFNMNTDFLYKEQSPSDNLPIHANRQAYIVHKTMQIKLSTTLINSSLSWIIFPASVWYAWSSFMIWSPGKRGGSGITASKFWPLTPHLRCPSWYRPVSSIRHAVGIEIH